MILFVGDTPSKRTDPRVPFRGAGCEKRLHKWISFITNREFLIVNRTDKDFKILLKIFNQSNLPVIALGNNASNAIGDKHHFKLPHPSGLNRQINNPAFISTKLQECRNWLSKSHNKR